MKREYCFCSVIESPTIATRCPFWSANGFSSASAAVATRTETATTRPARRMSLFLRRPHHAEAPLHVGLDRHAREDLQDLGVDLLRLLVVARRDVERHELHDVRVARELGRCARGEVRGHDAAVLVLGEERRL